jgi:mevalonate kinase
VIRAFAGFLGHPLADEQISSIAYEVEKIHHGTPSGIDNTVITYERPVFFIKGQPVEVFQVAKPFTIVIGDTGIPAPTKESVGDVRKAHQADQARYERFFAAAGSIARTARQAIEGGHPEWLGPLMNENHDLLQKMGVSSPELDRLVEVAQQAGAAGTKLSGGGRGGNMIALVENNRATVIEKALLDAGAVRTIITEVQ